MTSPNKKAGPPPHGARVNFAIAIALISLLPLLSLAYLSVHHTEAQPMSVYEWCALLLAIACSIICGYALQSRYPRAIVKLRACLEDIVEGELPEKIHLVRGEDDVTAVQDCMNLVLSQLNQKIETAETHNLTLEAKLIQAQKLESLGTLASGVAHEINNPINGIMNYAQLIIDKLGPDSEVSGFAVEIGKETERVAAIVKNLLAFSRDEKLSHSPANIHDILETTLSLIRTIIRADNIVLDIDVSKDLPQISCRSQQIQQVVMNLLTNARDALNAKYEGADENKRILLTASVITKNDRDWVRMTVEDRGHGVSDEVREHIFDPFYTTKPRDKGTGLGLSISYGIVKEHGGDVTMETEVGEWTRFHADLPMEASND